MTINNNSSGQLGNGNKKNQSKPVKIMKKVTEVSLGDDHSGAITQSGDLYCWGNNEFGQIGNGNKKNQSKPVKVMGSVKKIWMQSHNSAAITKNGDLYCWGDNGFQQTGTKGGDVKTPTKVMEKVTSYFFHRDNSGALTENGDLYYWGRKDTVLEDGSVEIDGEATPKKILEKVTYISDDAAITENGDLYRWGFNNYGDVGNGSTYVQEEPVKVLDEVIFVCQTTAIKKNGEFYSWGENGRGQVGNGTRKHQLTPQKIVILDNGSVSIQNMKIGNIPDRSYTGKAIKPAISITYKGKKLKKGTDYSISYKNNKNVGTATIILKGKGKYSGTNEVTFKIVPRKVSISGKIEAKSKGFSVKWKKQKKAVTGYEVQYSTSKKFVENSTETKQISKAAVTIKNLKKNKKYYVRIRGYKTVKGKKYYSAWSKTNTVKTK